eukprot:TRINITY_DN2167_c0_g1_i1.p1 TRINITY_DN2167_c0_g1~~TRINITY_DN2167_c0_g1_i1.p1  ORF type:complete len:238 (-),score=75.02 TRINITY_DN2167_c0_g1_i1:55-768(-)
MQNQTTMAQLRVDAALPLQNIREQKFSPYENNGGTVVAVAGVDYCIIASDTRLSEGYSIQTRNATKLIKLTDKCVLATSGFHGDTIALHKTLKIRLEMYEHQNGKPMSTPAIAQLLSNTLYYKRFFPYYCFNVLGGVDDFGIGCAFSYDAVGSFQRVTYSSSGTGNTLVQPLLDNQLDRPHQLLNPKEPVPFNVAQNIVKDAFTAAGERDIYTGDFVDIYTVTTTGVSASKLELKFD